MEEHNVFEKAESLYTSDWGKPYVGDEQALWQKVIDIDTFIETHRIPDNTEEKYRETDTDPGYEVGLVHEPDGGYNVKIRMSTGPDSMRPIANYSKNDVDAPEALEQVKHLLDEY